jgi:riboflavin kinase/FMN adenylyltransferase
MKVTHSLAHLPPLKKPISLTIGVFDGVHLGHKHLFQKLKEYHGSSVVLTFTNHPAELLRNEHSFPLLTNEKEKMELILKENIDLLILIPFSREIAEMTYQMFLSSLHQALDFNHLYIGENDALGKDRKGTPQALSSFGKKAHFSVHSIPKLTHQGKIISSSLIRSFLKEGNLIAAEELLGRKVSLSKIQSGQIKAGTYRVRVHEEGKTSFSEQFLTLEEGNPFEPKNPSIITFLNTME